MKISSMKYALALALMAGTFSSCNDFLDEMPDNRTELDSEAKITKMLVSAYPNTNYATIAELSSDNTDEIAGNYTAYKVLQEELYRWESPTFEEQDSPYKLWNDCYKAIAVANAALEAIEKAGNPESLSAQKGEALICRAYNHFILTNIFCKAYSPKTSTKDLGVPYMKHVENTVSPAYSRGTVAEDYAEMEKDILEALPLINDKIYSVAKYHFNKKAALAFAVRFYLYYVKDDKSNYDKVISYANQVLTDVPSSMMRDWKGVGSINANNSQQANAFIDVSSKANLLLYSTRSLWARYYGPYAVGERFCHNSTVASSETCKASALWGSFGNMYMEIPSYLNFQKVLMEKIAEYFYTIDPVQDTGEPYVMFLALTTDDVILNRAEAYAMKGNYDKAAADLNTFCNAFADMKGTTVTPEFIDNLYGEYNEETGTGRKYYSPEKATPKKELHPDFIVEKGRQENFIQAILHTRRIMSLHEGLRWFDIKRYGIVIYRRVIGTNLRITVTDTLDVDDPRRAIQLPTSVIKAGLEANPRNK